MSTKEFIQKQHEENVDWIKRLDFYKDEIKILQDRLDEITQKNNQKETLMSVDHFQNQLVIHRNTLDELRHKLVISEDKLQEEINRNPVATDHRKTEYHEAEKEEMQIFEGVFKELREEFNRFASKWM